MTRIILHFTFMIVILSGGICKAQQKVTVKGVVYDSAGKGIPGVKVSLYPNNNKDPIEVTQTKKDGSYEIDRAIGHTYDILYSHSTLDLAVVELLAEHKDQDISLKMYRKGEPRTIAAYHYGLQSAERVLLLVALDQDERESLVALFKDGSLELLKYDPSKIAEGVEDNKVAQQLLRQSRDGIFQLTAVLDISLE